MITVHFDSMTPQRLEMFAILSGWIPQSIVALRREHERYVERLAQRGLRSIPDLRCLRAWTDEDVRCANEISMMLLHKAGRFADAHDLRNLTAVRPFKP